MQFSDIIGYTQVKNELLARTKQGRIPHNILLEQQDGMPGIALAIAWFQFLNCENPSENDSCGKCRHCKMIQELTYPDLYFILPLVGASQEDDPSGNALPLWREMILEKGALFSSNDWLDALNAENSRPTIYANDATAIERKLNLHISENGYRMVIIYQPERMREDSSNKLLKLMEEPPQKTLFVSVSLNPDLLLETIISRMQRIEIFPLSNTEIIEALTTLFPQAPPIQRSGCAERADGVLLKAVNILRNKNNEDKFTDHYATLVNSIAQRNIAQLKIIASDIADKGREYAIACLEYFLTNFRFALRVYLDNNYPLATMNEREQKIEQQIHGWITPENIDSMYFTTQEAIAHIKGNVMVKMVLFDLFMQYTKQLMPYIRMVQAQRR